MKKKFALSDLKVASFVTESAGIRGGQSTNPATAPNCVGETHIPTHYAVC